jgi:hypothetical protein
MTRSPSSTVDSYVLTGTNELFQLAERIAVTAAFYVAGERFDVPFATLFSYLLWTGISVYGGNRLALMIRTLLPGTHSNKVVFWRGLFLTVAAAATCAWAIGILMEAMRKAVNAG